ncbi:hypothetical protein ES705_46130 [subsurface metagenome]
MFDEIIQFYQIGRSLGINKNEINRVFLSYSGRYKIMKLFCYAIIIIAFFCIFIFSLFMIISNPAEPTYPSNSFYSSVKVKDFKNKSRFSKRASPFYSRFFKVLNIGVKS